MAFAAELAGLWLALGFLPLLFYSSARPRQLGLRGGREILSGMTPPRVDCCWNGGTQLPPPARESCTMGSAPSIHTLGYDSPESSRAADCCVGPASAAPCMTTPATIGGWLLLILLLLQLQPLRLVAFRSGESRNVADGCCRVLLIALL